MIFDLYEVVRNSAKKVLSNLYPISSNSDMLQNSGTVSQKVYWHGYNGDNRKFPSPQGSLLLSFLAINKLFPTSLNN